MQHYGKPKSRNTSMNAGSGTKDSKVNVGSSTPPTTKPAMKSGSKMKSPKGFDSGLIDGKVS
mgnify:CR=1 FL=1